MISHFSGLVDTSIKSDTEVAICIILVLTKQSRCSQPSLRQTEHFLFIIYSQLVNRIFMLNIPNLAVCIIDLDSCTFTFYRSV